MRIPVANSSAKSSRSRIERCARRMRSTSEIVKHLGMTTDNPKTPSRRTPQRRREPRQEIGPAHDDVAVDERVRELDPVCAIGSHRSW